MTSRNTNTAERAMSEEYLVYELKNNLKSLREKLEREERNYRSMYREYDALGSDSEASKEDINDYARHLRKQGKCIEIIKDDIGLIRRELENKGIYL